MKAGMITFLRNGNYGSLLQAWALQQTVLELGWEAEFLDYAPGAGEKLRNLLRAGNSPKLLLEGIRKRQAGSEAARRLAELRDFRQRALRLTAPCGSGAALRQAAADCDLLLCGSDQIWSPVWLNEAYFFAWAPPEKRRAAYACSLGVTEIRRRHKAEKMRRWIAPFAAVSVREEAGAKALRQLLPEKNGIAVMPDPVFLRTREQWLELAVKPRRTEACLFCYFIGSRPDYWEKARAMAAEHGWRLVVSPVTAEACEAIAGGAAESGLRPEEWLGEIAGAAHVLTDSFHGAAFAALLGTPLTVLRRYRDGDPESKNSRLEQLQANLGAESLAPLLPSAGTDAALERLRRQGREWLAGVLAGG